MSKIVLSMIVKNEAGIIHGCLKSAAEICDYMAIVDTGSEDGTVDVVRRFLKNYVGICTGHGWIDFATNRNLALAEARYPAAEHVLVMDADDLLVCEAGFDIDAVDLDLDCYDIKIVYGGVEYWRPALFRNREGFFYRGVLHEFLVIPDGATRGRLEGVKILANASFEPGARAKNPEKYREDAALLEKAIEAETDPFMVARYTFYLAQSYRDCGEPKLALAHYLDRAEQDFWEEEIYMALVEAAKLMMAQAYGFMDVIGILDRAMRTVPTRAEAYYSAALYCRDQKRFFEARNYARRGLKIEMPGSGLFLQPWIYDYGLLDEFAISSYYAGDYRSSLDSCLKLLVMEGLPTAYFRRIAQNARFAADALT